MRSKISTSRTEALSPLSNLPEELRRSVIYPCSSLSTLGFLTQTSSHYETETAALRLLQAAIHAAPGLVDAKEDEKETKENTHIIRYSETETR